MNTLIIELILRPSYELKFFRQVLDQHFSTSGGLFKDKKMDFHLCIAILIVQISKKNSFDINSISKTRFSIIFDLASSIRFLTEN